MQGRLSAVALFSIAALTACGGSAGGTAPPVSSGGTTAPPTPTPILTATPTPTPATTSSFVGTVNSCNAGYIGSPQATPSPAPQSIPACSPNTGLGGATVIIGSVPAGCHGNACQLPSAALPSATTNASGAFAIANVPIGTYMLVVSNGSGYAALHTTVTMPLGSSPTYRLTKLSSTEQTWADDVNSRRVSGGTYVLPVDEYVQESIRACALYEGNGPTGPAQSYCNAAGDKWGGWAKYQAQYSANGGMFYLQGLGLSYQPNCCYPATGADGEFFNPADAGTAFSLSTSAVYMGLGNAPFTAIPGPGGSTFVFGQAQQ